MTDVTYSHTQVWLLIHCFPVMDWARQNDPAMWRAFTNLVQDQTGNVYLPEWNTSFLVNKMADDLGSYKELSDYWCQVEEAFDYCRDPSLL